MTVPITPTPAAIPMSRHCVALLLVAAVCAFSWWTGAPSGPYEVNWTYYPSWSGDERFVMLPLHDVMNSPLRILLNDVTYESRPDRPPS